MTTELLRAVVVLEVIMVLWLLIAQAAYALVERRSRRRAVAVDRTRSAVLKAVVSGDPDSGCAAINALDPSDRDAVLCSIASSVQSQRDPLFGEIADRVGTSSWIDRALQSRRWWVRRSALRRLTVLGCTSERAMSLLEDRAPRVRAVAAEWYGQTAPAEDAAARLVAMLGDEDERVRTSAMTGLCPLGTAATPALASGLIADDRHRLLATIKVIGAMADRTTARTVRPLVDHEDPEVMIEALLTVAPALAAADADFLRQLVGHEDPRVRRSAIAAAGTAGLSPLVGPVAQALDDPNGAVREAAIAALDHLGNGGKLLLDRAARVGVTSG